MDILRGFAYTKHGNMEYRELGKGEQVVVFLHPTPSSSAFYNELLPLLDPGKRYIAITTMGYGQSDRPPQPYATLEEFAQAVIWTLDELSIKKFSLFGAHTGSQIAMALAAKWPNRIEKLILEEPFNWNNPRRRAVHEAIHKYVPESSDGSHLITLWKKTKDFPGLGEPPNDKHHLQLFIDQLISNSNDGCEEIYGDMGWEGAGPFAMCTFDTWDAVPNISAKTLVIHGTTSELARSHDKFLDLIPNVTGIRLPSEGNFLPHDAPDLWAKELNNFLN